MAKLLLFIFLISDFYQFNDTNVGGLGPLFPPDPGADNVPPPLGLTGALSLAGYHHPGLAAGALPGDDMLTSDCCCCYYDCCCCTC